MAKPLTSWTVFEHGPIEELEDNLWRVEGVLPGTPMKRVMTLARLGDGRVLVYSAIALGEAEMKRIEAWGAPSILVVPNALHKLDARVFKERYPAMKVVAPKGAAGEVAEVVAVDATSLDTGDPDVRWRAAAGTADREAILEVRGGRGTTVVVCDLVMNMRKIPGFGGFVMKLMGFTGPAPKVSPATRKALVADRAAVRAELEGLGAIADLRRVIMAHGAMLAGDEAKRVAEAAASL